MAITRKQTRNIVVVMSGTPRISSVWDVSCAYRDRGVSDIGSHYLILEDGDVEAARPHTQHGNVHPEFNANAVFIEIMGKDNTAITAPQQQALRGVISMMEELYDAEELDLTGE
jgi:hypothetical protein